MSASLFLFGAFPVFVIHVIRYINLDAELITKPVDTRTHSANDTSDVFTVDVKLGGLDETVI